MPVTEQERNILIEQWVQAEIEWRGFDEQKLINEIHQRRDDLMALIKTLKAQIFVQVLPAQKPPQRKIAHSTKKDLMSRVATAMENGPLTIDELAERVGVTRNQARGCMSSLVTQKLAVRLGESGSYKLIGEEQNGQVNPQVGVGAGAVAAGARPA